MIACICKRGKYEHKLPCPLFRPWNQKELKREARGSRRRQMPRPNVPLLMDAKLAKMCRVWDKLDAMVKNPSLRKAKWSEIETTNTAIWLYGEALEKMAERMLELYRAQYPVSHYVR